MRFLKSCWDDLRAVSDDLSAVVWLSLFVSAFYLCVRYGPVLGYLEPLALLTAREVTLGALGLVLLRFIARMLALQFPNHLRVAHRLAAVSNRALMFGVLPVVAAGTAVLTVSPWAPPSAGGVQFGIIVLIAVAQSVRKAPFLPESVAPSGSEADSSVADPVATDSAWPKPAAADSPVAPPATLAREEPGSLRLLAGCLALTVLIIIAGEAVVTQFMPWTTYPLDTYTSTSSRYILEDGNELVLVPRSIVRVRYTRTRREIDIERGSVLIAVCACIHPLKEEHFVPLTVRAGVTRVKLTPAGLGQTDKNAGLLVQQEFTTTEVFVKRGPSVTLETPLRGAGTLLSSWWSASRTLKPGEWATVTPSRLQVQPITGEEAQKRLAWTQDTLAFEGESLADAVIEVNKYSNRPLEIYDNTITKTPVHGTFQLGWPNLAERFVVALEREGKARQIPNGREGAIQLIAFNAGSERYGPGAVQATQDTCAGYRSVHERRDIVWYGDDTDPSIDFDVAGCDLATSLAAYAEQTSFRGQIVMAPEHTVLTRPVKGRYRAKEALMMMLAGTACTAAGDRSEGWKILCPDSQGAYALNTVRRPTD